MNTGVTVKWDSQGKNMNDEWRRISEETVVNNFKMLLLNSSPTSALFNTMAILWGQKDR
jgi:hypothetical protein